MKILFVDDDDIYWELFCSAVASVAPAFSDSIHRLSDGDQVMSYLDDTDSESDWPQLILLDQRMPRMDGTQVLPLLKQHAQACAVPVCLMSSSTRPALVARAYQLGATFYIVKPLEFEVLKQKVSSILTFWSSTAELPPPLPIQGGSPWAPPTDTP